MNGRITRLCGKSPLINFQSCSGFDVSDQETRQDSGNQ
jgi:hypothetical protein